MKRTVEFVMLSTLLVLLAVFPIGYLLLFGTTNIQYSWIVAYNILFIIGLLILGVRYLNLHPYNRQLLSQRILIAVLGIEILKLVLQLTATAYTAMELVEIARWLYAANRILLTIQVFMLIYYISIFKEYQLKLFSATFAIFVIVANTSVIALDEFQIGSWNGFTAVVTLENYTQLIFVYPSLGIILVTLICYLILGVYIINSIVRPSNYKELRYNPLLSLHYILVILGFGCVFFAAPMFDLLQFYYPTSLLLVITQTSILQIGLLLIALPNLYNTEAGYNFIPQSIEKLVVMNNVGLPLASYEFDFRERILYSDILMTSSLSAIVTYLTHSKIISSRVDAIKFVDRILVFRIEGDLSFISIVRKKTRILESALNVFIHEFFRDLDPRVTSASYVKTTQIDTNKIDTLVNKSFGTNYEGYRPQLSKNQTTLALGKIIVAMLFVLTSFRLVIYQGTTILLPPDVVLVPILLVFMYATSIFLVILIVHARRFQPRFWIHYLLLANYVLLLIIPPGIASLVLTWVFAALSWVNLTGIWQYIAGSLPYVWRYRSFLLAIVLDISLRIPSVGTDLIIFRGQFWFYHIMVVLILLIMSRYFTLSLTEKSISCHNWSILSMVHLVISFMVVAFFGGKIGDILASIGGSMEAAYIVVNVTWIGLLFLSSSSALANWSYRYYRIFRILHYSVLIALVFSYLLPPVASTIVITLGPVSIAYTLGMSSQMTRLQIPKLLHTSLLFLIPTLVLLLFVIAMYGGSLLLVVVPILLIIGLQTSVQQQSILLGNEEVLTFGIIILIVIGFAFPAILFTGHGEGPVEREFGVMTYNLHYGVANDFTYNVETIGHYIGNSGVSVVGLQEVTRASLINGNGDMYYQLGQILNKYGYEYSTIMTMSPSSLTNAIFSKYPIVESQSILFEDNVVFQRGMLLAAINVTGSILSVGVTHLTHVYTQEANQTRSYQISSILDNLDPGFPTILMGDFNIEPTSPEISPLVEIYVDTGMNGSDLTWPSTDPRQRIDYIFHSDLTQFMHKVPLVEYSDHLPVVAWFDL